MEFAEPSVELMSSSIFPNDVYRDIEYAAHICYAAEESIDRKKFLISLFNRHHMRPFEFGTLYIMFNTEYVNRREDMDITFNMTQNSYSKYHIIKQERSNQIVFLTTNCRVLLENLMRQYAVNEVMERFFEYIETYMMYNPEYHFERYTFRWTISRATADEFRTHTRISSLMQSTRYCNYSLSKFGGQIKICTPRWLQHTNPDEMTAEEKWYYHALVTCESVYQGLSEPVVGITPQCARGILPLDIKTEFIQCAYVEDWQQFFDQRAHDSTGKAQPDAKHIATIAEEKLLSVII